MSSFFGKGERIGSYCLKLGMNLATRLHLGSALGHFQYQNFVLGVVCAVKLVYM